MRLKFVDGIARFNHSYVGVDRELAREEGLIKERESAERIDFTKHLVVR